MELHFRRDLHRFHIHAVRLPRLRHHPRPALFAAFPLLQLPLELHQEAHLGLCPVHCHHPGWRLHHQRPEGVGDASGRAQGGSGGGANTGDTGFKKVFLLHFLLAFSSKITALDFVDKWERLAFFSFEKDACQ